MLIRKCATILACIAPLLVACSGDSAVDEAAPEAPGAVRLPIEPAPPPNGSLNEFVQWFVRSEGYVEQDVALVNSAVTEGLLPPADTGVPIPADAFVTPLGRAILVLETREKQLLRARFRVRYGSAVVDDPDSDERLTLSIVQVDRYSLRDTVVAAGVGVAAGTPEDAAGAHVSWRMVMYPKGASASTLVAASRSEIPDTIAARDVCLGAPCMAPESSAEQVAQWEVMEELEVEFRPRYALVRHGMLSPAAALELAVAELGGAWLDNGNMEWRGFELKESVIPGLPYVEGVVETGLGPDEVVEAYVRESDLMDDAVLARWQRVVSLPSSGAATGAAAGEQGTRAAYGALYGSRAFERRAREP